jgi:glucose/arabinose dehydrogenase
MMLRTPDHGGCAPFPAGRLVLWCAFLAALCAVRLDAADDSLGVRVPEGFEVSLYADNELASDIFSMTIDSLGRVVVSGPGYVRILVDADGDGRAETFKPFADGPASGAQGMVFHGRDLLCTGDEGLIRFRDADGDDRADGPADLFLKIKAGGEHDAHAVRRGADGWWYLISGNTAGVDEKYVALGSSPVRYPRHGTIMRFQPDLTAGELFAHGYRNAYDFDFNADGDLLTFDSDGEREISLPAYQPTRVFHAAPGSHAGWMSDHWKRPGYFSDMPPVLG